MFDVQIYSCDKVEFISFEFRVIDIPSSSDGIFLFRSAQAFCALGKVYVPFKTSFSGKGATA